MATRIRVDIGPKSSITLGKLASPPPDPPGGNKNKNKKHPSIQLECVCERPAAVDERCRSGMGKAESTGGLTSNPCTVLVVCRISAGLGLLTRAPGPREAPGRSPWAIRRPSRASGGLAEAPGTLDKPKEKKPRNLEELTVQWMYRRLHDALHMWHIVNAVPSSLYALSPASQRFRTCGTLSRA